MKTRLIILTFLLSASIAISANAEDLFEYSNDDAIPEVVVDDSIRNAYEESYLVKLVENSKTADELLKKQREDELKQAEESKEENLLKNKSYKNYKDALQENDETIGWIRINGLSVDYPIMYSGDDKYLTINFEQEEDANGAIYLDKNSNGTWGNVNLIHGHNMKSGKMFGMLDEYKDQDFAKEHDNIEIASSEGVKQYKVFSVIVADSDTEEVQYSFSKEEDFYKYVDKLYERSVVELQEPDDYSDVIILSTCSYQFNNAHTLVCAYNR